ncbi:MAG: hypothetical protein PVF22_07630 [Candidatus Aminicenantes bacterium]
MTLVELKKTYGDLKEGKVHSHDCSCASCLYFYMKLKNRDSWIDKDSFFLYWLAFRHLEKKEKAADGIFLSDEYLEQNWTEILGLYDRIISQKGKKGKKQENIFKKKYPTRSEQFKIISQYDKKYNIAKLSNVKKGLVDILHVKISPLLLEIEKILDCVRGMGVQTPHAYLLPRDMFLKYNKLTKKALKIAVFLNKTGKKEKINFRFLSRKYHLCKKDLTIILEYLEQKHILEWDKETNEIVLCPGGTTATVYYIDWIEIIRGSLKSMFPFSTEIARKASAERSQLCLG